MTIANPYFSRPQHLNRPRHREASISTKIATAQTLSTKVRKAPITLPKPKWETDEQREDRA